MRTPALPIIAFATLALTSFAADPPPATRPSGVDEAHWVALSETFGFVVTKDSPVVHRFDSKTGKRITFVPKYVPSVTGFFAVRRDGVWCRVNIEPNDGALSLLRGR